MTDASANPWLTRLLDWAQAHPGISLSLLRRFQPILQLPDTVVVSRFDDVQEVLARDAIFAVPYEEKMRIVTGGENFFLGMENSPEYTRDVSNMRIVVRRDDLHLHVLPAVESCAQLCMDAFAGAGEADLVAQLCNRVPVQVVGRYFGILSASPADFAGDLAGLFAYLFFPEQPARTAEYLAAAERCRKELDRAIADRKQSQEMRDDVLGRCLKLQSVDIPGFCDLQIRNNLIGLLIGAVPTTGRAAALTLNYLLDNPVLLQQAQAAAQENNIDLLNRFVLESLRFTPFVPAIIRLCTQDYQLASGLPHARTIKAGKVVLVLTQAAMLDEQHVAKPGEFRLDRPDHIYMHYGYGLHACFGRYLNSVQIAGIIKAALLLPNLRRMPGSDADQVNDSVDPFRTKLMVKFDA
jgi:cytochrome P450